MSDKNIDLFHDIQFFLMYLYVIMYVYEQPPPASQLLVHSAIRDPNPNVIKLIYVWWQFLSNWIVT